MALKYKNEEEIRAINTATSGSFTRLSDARQRVHKYLGGTTATERNSAFGEVDMLRQSTPLSGITDTRSSDMWVAAQAFSGTSVKRADEDRRVFHEQNGYSAF